MIGHRSFLAVQLGRLEKESAPCFHKERIRKSVRLSDSVAIPIGMVAVVPLRMAAIPRLRVIVGLPIRGIGIAVAMVMTVIIMPVAHGNAEIADLDADNVLGSRRHGGQGGAGQTSGRKCDTEKPVHG